MDIYNIFPTPVHVFKAEFDFKQIISNLEEEDYINVNQAQPEHPERVWQTRHDLHKDPRYKEITDFFEDCVEQYRSHYEYECEKLDISIKSVVTVSFKFFMTIRCIVELYRDTTASVREKERLTFVG